VHDTSIGRTVTGVKGRREATAFAGTSTVYSFTAVRASVGAAVTIIVKT
jgi:hypothetical protein